MLNFLRHILYDSPFLQHNLKHLGLNMWIGFDNFVEFDVAVILCGPTERRHTPLASVIGTHRLAAGISTSHQLTVCTTPLVALHMYQLMLNQKSNIKRSIFWIHLYTFRCPQGVTRGISPAQLCTAAYCILFTSRVGEEAKKSHA